MYFLDFPVAQMVENMPAMQETWVWSLGLEDSLEKEMATHSSILAWRIPWTEGPGGLQSMGLQRVGHDWATNTYTCTFTVLFLDFWDRILDHWLYLLTYLTHYFFLHLEVYIVIIFILPEVFSLAFSLVYAFWWQISLSICLKMSLFKLYELPTWQ